MQATLYKYTIYLWQRFIIFYSQIETRRDYVMPKQTQHRYRAFNFNLSSLHGQTNNPNPNPNPLCIRYQTSLQKFPLKSSYTGCLQEPVKATDTHHPGTPLEDKIGDLQMEVHRQQYWGPHCNRSHSEYTKRRERLEHLRKLLKRSLLIFSRSLMMDTCHFKKSNINRNTQI